MIHAIHALSVQYLDNPVIFHNRLPYYAERVYHNCGLVETDWEFTDGTLCKTCQPRLFEKLMYSGHKRCHRIKFQSVVTPDGWFASIYGWVSGERHDSFLLSSSGHLDKLPEFVPDDTPEDIEAVIYSLYGDQLILSQFIILGDTKILLMGVLMLIGFVKCPRLVCC